MELHQVRVRARSPWQAGQQWPGLRTGSGQGLGGHFMGTQRTRLLCNAPTAVKPLGLAPRESRVGREVSGTLCGVEHRGRTESESHCTRARKACEGLKGWPQWGVVGVQGGAGPGQSCGGTHQAGALETRVGAGPEVGPLLVKLPLILAAWGGLPG